MSDEHKEIWLQPWCAGCKQHSGCEGRQWCQDDVWGKCDECGEKSVRYVLAPAVPSRSRTRTDDEVGR
jgi:hypothetical protein